MPAEDLGTVADRGASADRNMPADPGTSAAPGTSPAPAGVRLRPAVAALPAYRQGRVPDAEGYKLSSNENPYPPLPGVVEAVAQAVAFNRYPDATGRVLRERLAERFGVGADEVHLGAGSVSLLAQLLTAVADEGDEVVYAWRSFEAYPSLVAVTGAASVRVPLTSDARHDVDAMFAAVTPATRAVIVCSPNNPTGPAVTHEEVERLLARVPSDVLVILDEAYREFVTAPDAVDGARLVGRHPNLVVLRTFSKAYGLAALRLGYAVGAARVLDAARAAAIPLSVTEAAQVAAHASLDREDELLERVAAIVERRDRLARLLAEDGTAVPEPQGNFVWLETGEETDALADDFFAAGLAVRAFSGDGIRISVGEEESLDRVAAVVRVATARRETDRVVSDARRVADADETPLRKGETARTGTDRRR